MIRRLLRRIDDNVSVVLDRHLRVARITSSVSPDPLRGLDINPREIIYPCCRHCAAFAPAPCPIKHTSPCPDIDCAQGGDAA